MMMIWMMDITLQPAIKSTKYYKHMFTYKSYCEDKNYLNGTSGSESELPEDNVSSDGIALVLG